MKKTKKSGSSVVRLILLALIGIVIGVKLYNANAGFLRNDLPMPFGVGAAVVMSGSMSPALEVDDIVIVKATDERDIGDIVVYESSGTLVVHRITDISGDTVTTKGDANNTADEPFDESLIKGKVILRVKGVGKVMNFIKNPIVTAVMVILAVAFIILSGRKEKSHDDEEFEELRKEIERLIDERHFDV